MADQNTLLQLSAFSGLAGALLTQTLTGLFGYYSDKRKSYKEIKASFRNREVEIAENFYFVTGEKMAVVKKNIGYWKRWNEARSEASLNFLDKEIKKLNDHMDKLDTDNWQYNVAGLYFNISLANETVIESNDKTKRLYLRVLDLSDQIKRSIDNNTEQLYGEYALAIFDLCAHYEEVYALMQNDLQVVKNQMLKEFAD